MQDNNFEIGHKLYALDNKENIIEYNVLKVGRKYLEVARKNTGARDFYFDKRQVFKDTLREKKDWGSPMCFYRSAEEVETMLERGRLLNFLSRALGSWDSPIRKKLSLDTLRKIKSLILEECNNAD